MSGRRLVALLSAVSSVLALTVAGSVVARTSVPASGFMPRVPAPLADKGLIPIEGVIGV